MAEWNLSVHLTGQGSDLASTLRSSAKEARKLKRRVDEAKQAVTELRAAAADGITFRLDLDAGHLRTDVDAALRSAGGGALGVRLDLDAAHLRNEVDTALSAAGAGQGLSVRLDLDADHLRSDVTAALTAAGSGQDLRVQLGVDTAHLRDEVDAALAFAGAGQGLQARLGIDAAHLRDEVRDALTTAGAGQDLTVGLHVDGATALAALRTEAQQTARTLNVLQRAAREARNELEELEARARTTATAVRRIASASDRSSTRLDTLATSTRTLRGDLDDLNGSLTTVGGSLGGLRGRVGGLAQSNERATVSARSLLAALAALATAGVPLAAGLTTSLAPLAGQFTAGGTAAAAFGIALAGQAGRLEEVVDAEEKYAEAVREHGRASTEAVEAQVAHQKALAELSPEAQRAAVAYSRLKASFEGWSDDMTAFTMEPVTRGMTVLDELIPRLTPHVEAASTQLDRLTAVAGGAIQTPGFDALADKYENFSERTLTEMTTKVINFLAALSRGEGVTSGPVAEFIAYARANGPAAREALAAIGDALMTLMEAASIAGPVMLTVVTALARLVAALPPEAVAIALQLAAAIKILSLSMGLMTAAASSGAVARLGAYFAVMRAAGVATTLRATAASMTAMQRAAVALGVLGVAAYAVGELADEARGAPPDVDRLTTSLKELARTGDFSGELKASFGDLDGLIEDIGRVGKAAKDQEAYVASFGNSGLKPLDDLRRGFHNLVDDFRDGEDSFKALEGRFESLDQSLASMVSSGYADEAASNFDLVKQAALAQGKSLEEVNALFPEYRDAVASLEAEQQLAAQGMGLFGQAALDTQAKLDAQKQSADGLRQSIVALNDVNRAAGSAMSAFEQSLDDTTKAVKEHSSALKMRDGELDLGSEKARNAEKVLSELAANTDAAATAAREQGKSWSYVAGIQEEGRAAFIAAADAMGLTKAQAEALANAYLDIPDSKTTTFDMRTEDAVAGLDAVIAAIEATPNAKSVKVDALTADAEILLEQLGFQVTQLKDGTFKVTAHTDAAKDSLGDVQRVRDGLQDKTVTVSGQVGDAIADLEAVQQKVAGTKGKTIEMRAPTAEARAQLEALGFKIRDTKGKTVVISVPTGGQQAAVDSLRGAIASLRDKSVTITTRHVVVGDGSAARKAGSAGAQLREARGGVVDYYADGGIQRGGIRHFASGSEHHVAQFAPAGSWRVWAEPETGGEAYIPLSPSKRPRSRAIAEETVRRLGGDPAAIAWNADGNITDWRYDPQTGSLFTAADAGKHGNKTRKVKVKGKNGKVTIREIEYFDLKGVENRIKATANATKAWNKDLEKVADRVGGDVAEALASMGEEGRKLAAKMANGSVKYINDMAKALRGLQQTAKASLTDYTRQLTGANKMNKAFADNLTRLAGMGYGDLAAQLAEQNDEAAQQLASSAVRDRKKAAKANTAAKTANSALTADQVQDLVQIIAAITTKRTGIHDVAATTGLGEDVIIAVANKATGPIRKALGTRADRFFTDLKKANRGLAYADGGIRSGIYATRGGAVTFAEPSTGGEAYIPLGANKRAHALPVLSEVASRFGLGLTDAQAARPVVIVQGGGDTTVNVSAVRTGASASDIGAQVGRSVRRARRGGVAARAA